MYKMLAFDLDGTLNNDDKVITPMTREAIMAVQEQGVVVALVSGRQAPGLQREADALHLQDYHGLRISYNGGRIEDATTGEILFDSSIDEATAVEFPASSGGLAGAFANRG
jgi:HAD superfamily hydrolase (TIGR01484 family)